MKIQKKKRNEISWLLMAGGATALSSVLVRASLKKGWSKVKKTAPPDDPAARGVTWPAALAWGFLTGAAVGMSRVAGHRTAASGWRRVTGTRPPKK